MSDTSHDGTIDDLIRHIMEAAGTDRPIIIGMQIIITPGAPGPGREGTEPEIEVHTFGNRVTLVTELPGMSAEDVQVLFREDRVYIWAKDHQRHYRASARVPPAQEDTIGISFRNGVLEVSYSPLSLPPA
jgi:HSP20 family molecular chaperone IbpA